MLLSPRSQFEFMSRSSVGNALAAQDKRVRRRRRPATKSAVARVVRQEIDRQAELKFHTVNGPTGTPVYVGNPYNMIMTDISQGQTDTTRVGDSVYIKNVDIRLWIRYPAPDTSIQPNAIIRVVVYQYKPNNGLLAPSLSRLYVDDYTTDPGPLSHRNIDHHNDFNVLLDECFTMSACNAATGTSPSNSGVFIHRNLDMKRITKKIQYDTASAAHNNALYLLIFSSSANLTVDPTVDCQSRVRFTDL